MIGDWLSDYAAEWYMLCMGAAWLIIAIAVLIGVIKYVQ